MTAPERKKLIVFHRPDGTDELVRIPLDARPGQSGVLIWSVDRDGRVVIESFQLVADIQHAALAQLQNATDAVDPVDDPAEFAVTCRSLAVAFTFGRAPELVALRPGERLLPAREA